MAKINRIIPFGLWPANWGMVGTRRAAAEAEYYWDGEDLDRRLLDINHPDKDSKEHKEALCKIDRRYNKISEIDAEHLLLELKFDDHESKEFLLAKLDLELKHKAITEQQWEKATATLNGEPWFDYMSGNVTGRKDGQQIAIELDWNEFFPRYLEEQGWTGPTDDAIVDAWFTEAMRQMLLPDLSPDQIQAMEDDDYIPRRGAQRKPGQDGRTEYS